MNNKLRLVWIVALLLLVAGVGLTFMTFGQLDNVNKKLKDNLTDIGMMLQSKSDLSVYIAAKEAYSIIPGAHPVRFESVFDPSNAVAAENIRASEIELSDGWFLLRREVVIADGALDNMMTIIRKAEAQRPPWRLSSCTVKSSAIAAGHGRVVLLFEAMEQRNNAER